MQSIILAAGRGSRLTAAGTSAKCLVNIGGMSLLHYQLAMHRRLGVRETCVVVGHQAELVRRAAGEQCTFIDNHQYLTTNSLYSLYLARQWVEGELLIANGDVLSHPAIYERLLAAPTSALVYDSSSGREPEHMKVGRGPDGQLRGIGKLLPLEQSHGENVGLIRIMASDVPQFFADVEEVLRERGVLEWAPAAAARFAGHAAFGCIDIAGLPWCEIDYDEDLQTAREVVLPRIKATSEWFALPAAEIGESVLQ